MYGNRFSDDDILAQRFHTNVHIAIYCVLPSHSLCSFSKMIPFRDILCESVFHIRYYFVFFVSVFLFLVFSILLLILLFAVVEYNFSFILFTLLSLYSCSFASFMHFYFALYYNFASFFFYFLLFACSVHFFFSFFNILLFSILFHIYFFYFCAGDDDKLRFCVPNIVFPCSVCRRRQLTVAAIIVNCAPYTKEKIKS